MSLFRQDERRYGKIIHQGFLYRIVRSAWCKRYAVLWEDMKLRFYDDQSRRIVFHEIKLKHVDDVKQLSISELECKELNSISDNFYYFSIKSFTLKKPYIIRCTDKEDLSKWITILQEKTMGTTNPAIIEITQYVTFYYIRNNMESLYGTDRTFQFPEGLTFLCSSYIGAIMNEEQYLNRMLGINEIYKSQIAEIREKSNDTILSEVCKELEIKQYIPTQIKEYQGHFGKLYALDWSDDSKYIVTCSQDGKLIVWDAYSTNKKLSIQPHCSAWILAVTFSPKYDLVAFGGLDDVVTIYKCTDDDGQKLTVNDEKIVDLQKHEGYISCIRFVNSDNEVLSVPEMVVVYYGMLKNKRQEYFLIIMVMHYGLI